MDKKKLQKLKKPLLNLLYPCIAIALVLIVWAIFSAVKNKPFLYPAPAEALTIFFGLGKEGGFFAAIFGSIGRTLLCFLISFLTAFVVAAAAGIAEPIHKLMTPIVSILRSVPTMAVILLCMLWLDYQSAPVLIGFLIAFPILYQSIYTAIDGVDKDLIEMAKLYKVSAFDRVRSIFVPTITPAVFDTIQSSLPLTLKVVIAAEVLCYTKNSIGFNMIKANLTAEISLLLAWTLLAVVISFVFELIVIGLKKLWEVAR